MLKGILCLAGAMLVALPAAGQKENLLDVMTVRVKPERSSDFRAIVRKMADLNRRKGDHWLTLETAYGERHTVSFISPRADFASIDKGMAAFMGALAEALGRPGIEKMFRDFDNTIVSSRAEVRRRRWDLSANVPADEAGMVKLIGEMRWLGTTVVRVRPGRGLDYEQQLKNIKEAAERNARDMTLYVSQSIVGTDAATYYISTPKTSMADFDKITPLAQILGREGLERYLRASSEIMEGVYATLSRVAPELSSMPAEIVKIAPSFWTPAAPPRAEPKPKPAAVKKQ